jgi:hypothetical protein
MHLHFVREIKIVKYLLTTNICENICENVCNNYSQNQDILHFCNNKFTS